MLPTSQVGQTGLNVPVLGLGTAPLGLSFAGINETQAVETVHYALEHGVTFIDTAPYYDAELVETRVGVALAGVPRADYVLATKVGRVLDADDVTYLDFTRAGVLQSIEGSLNRLGVDRVDILHLHAPEGEYHTRMALEQAYPLLDDLRKQGIIQAVGVGENFWEPLVTFAREASFDCFLLAGRYTLLEQGALDALNRFQAQGISIFGAGVYNSGILAKGAVDGAWYQYAAAPAAIVEKVRQIEQICQQHGVPLNAAAVQFVKAHPAVTALVIGAESPTQLAGTLAALEADIPPAFWDDLRVHNLIDAAAPT